MNQSDEAPLSCIGCGTTNPPGAEICSGCGHRFHEPRAIPPPTAPPSNPYEAPRTPLGRVPTFRISTVMALVAVVAVCLGAFVASPILGVFATLGILPASIRTAYVSDRRRAQGKPLGLGEQTATFLTTLGAAYLVSLASLIAFGVTCFPIGLMSMGNNVNNSGFPGLYVGIGAGLIVAIFVAVLFSRFLLRAGREGFGNDRRGDANRGPR